ncbi:MAG TPA: acetyl-CoA decarbonylase/synthase complex subunit delta [bacterium]|nr:acetyl-CoA decarbonylase/synthase complex subunit delta [bacterium]
MAIQVMKETYSGKIREVEVGKGPKAVKVGGAQSYPFHGFEGSLGNPPRIAWEMWDAGADEAWPDAAKEPFADVLQDPAAWAKKLSNEYKAEIISLRLQSIDPNGMNASAMSAVETVKKVLEAIEVPLIVCGVWNQAKDQEVLRKIAEECEGRNLALCPIEEGTYKTVGAGVIGFGQLAVASTPIDVNLAKQLNTLLGNLGVKPEKILMDPTTGGLGYGLEYSFSVMERDRMAALVQQDDKMQQPLICFLSYETWKTKEARMDEPKMGPAGERAIAIEAMTAMTLLTAGADVLVMRHPRAIAKVQEVIKELC